MALRATATGAEPELLFLPWDARSRNGRRS